MPKSWNLAAHPSYFSSLRNHVDDNERFLLVQAIWQHFEQTDDPTAGVEAVQNRPGRYALYIGRYKIIFGIPTEYDPPIKLADDIDLILIRKVEIE